MHAKIHVIQDDVLKMIVDNHHALKELREMVESLSLETMTVAQVAKKLHCTEAHVRRIKHKIGCSKPGKELVFTRGNVAAYLEQKGYRN